MNWKGLWLKTFGVTDWLGINIGFWIGIVICVIVVVGMNLIFWNMKSKKNLM
ncbi:MAG: hypothetical protein RSG52_12805 [Terrisporobacter sp.]|uniref:hypothetical protein n=1 Tax=Terrisporobacter sp. TaxID=1965305 RepID=UPI002FC70B2B